MRHFAFALLLALGAVLPAAADNHQSWSFSSRDSWTRLHVEIHGLVELTDDEKDVKSVTPGGSFEISSRGWLSLFGRRYTVRATPDGTLMRRFSVGAAERPITDDTRAWIADVIDELTRHGFGAEARAGRIVAQRGPAGLLEEIPLLRSDYTKTLYFTLLFKQGGLDRESFSRAIRLAAKEIGSDFERARVITAAAKASPVDDALEPAYVEAIDSIGSDFEHARVLRALVETDQPPRAAVKTVLASAAHIGSDFEKARVLRILAQKKDVGADASLGIVRVAASIGSDFEHSRVLLDLVMSQPIDAATRQALVETVARIGSDYERGRVMSAMLKQGALH